MATRPRFPCVAAALVAAITYLHGHAVAQGYVLQPGDGLQFAQLDFTFPGATSLDSEYASAIIDFQQVAAASGITKGWVNVATPQGWVVRNAPHDASLDFPGISWMFNLGAAGNISSLTVHAEVSAQVVTAFAPPLTTRFSVGNQAWNAEGTGATATTPPGGPMNHAGAVFVANPPQPPQEHWQSGHPNVEQEKNQCHTAAIANSLQWLEDKTGINVPQPHQPGGPGSNTLVGAIDAASNRQANQATPWTEVLDGKLRYLDLNNLGDDLVVKHKNAPGGTHVPAGNRTVGSATSYGYDANGTDLFDFILAELAAGEDVELVLEWPDGTAHTVQARGAGVRGGVPFVSFNHDAKQGAAGGNTSAADGGFFGVNLAADRVTATNLFNKAQQPAKLSFAISESPWGLPSPSAPSTPVTPSNPTQPTGPGKGTVTTKPLPTNPGNPANPESATATTTSSGTVTVSTSDGRGDTWTPSVRVDQDPGQAPKSTQADSIWIGDDALYAAWTDERFGSLFEQMYFVRSLDGGASWLGEHRTASMTAPGVSRVVAWRMVVVSGPPSDQVHVLLLADPGNGLAEPWHIVSRDGGITWDPPTPVGTGFLPGISRAIDLALHVEGDRVHVAWVDDRLAPGLADDVWYQRSDDGGATWMPADLQLDSSPPGIGFHDGSLALRGAQDLIAAAWTEKRISPVHAEIRLNASRDGGTNWMSSDVRVGGFDPLSANAFDMDLAVHDAGTFVIWDDNRNGPYEAFLASSFAAGAYFDPDIQLSFGGAESPSFARGDAPLAAIFIGGGGQPQPMVCTTGDDGQSWRLPIPIGGAQIGQPSLPVVAWNPAYGKAIATWRSDATGTTQQYTGGVRPQHLTPVGVFSAGSSVQIDLSAFPWAEFGWQFRVVCAGHTGTARLPGDGRATGLRLDNILQLSIAQPQLRGTLGAGGTGSTLPVVVPPTLLPGTTLWFFAVTLDPAGGFGSLTELVPVVVQ